MREMRTIVTDVHSVCLSVMQLDSTAHTVCAGHLMQPLPNYFGFLLTIEALKLCRYFLCQCCYILTCLDNKQ